MCELHINEATSQRLRHPSSATRGATRHATDCTVRSFIAQFDTPIRCIVTATAVRRVSPSRLHAVRPAPGRQRGRHWDRQLRRRRSSREAPWRGLGEGPRLRSTDDPLAWRCLCLSQAMLLKRSGITAYARENDMTVPASHKVGLLGRAVCGLVSAASRQHRNLRWKSMRPDARLSAP